MTIMLPGFEFSLAKPTVPEVGMNKKNYTAIFPDLAVEKKSLVPEISTTRCVSEKGSVHQFRYLIG